MRRPLLLVVLASIVLVVAALAAQAEEGAKGMKVVLVHPPDTPPLSYFTYHLAGGQSREDALDLTNGTDSPMEIRIYAGDGLTGNDGTLGGPLFGEKSSAAGLWVALDTDTVTLAPQQTRRVKFKFTVPPQAAVGDHFAFIFCEPRVPPKTKAPTTGGPATPKTATFAVEVRQRLGICILQRVPGKTETGMKVTGVRKVIRDGRVFLEFTIENTGNTFLKPVGSWSVRSASGEVLASATDQQWGYLLPGTKIQAVAPLATARPIVRGSYTVSVKVRHGDTRSTESVPIALP